MVQSIFFDFIQHFSAISGLNTEDLKKTLKVTIKIDKDDPGIKKRGFLSSPETDKPPILDKENIIIEGFDFDNLDLIVIKGVEYYMLCMYSQWKSQYNYRKYSDLSGYIGNSYEVSQDVGELHIKPEVINSSLRNTLLFNLFINLDGKISSKFDENKASKWWAFLQKVNQHGQQIIYDIDRRGSITVPTFSFINSMYKIDLPLGK
jgi:hypothetical protein